MNRDAIRFHLDDRSDATPVVGENVRHDDAVAEVVVHLISPQTNIPHAAIRAAVCALHDVKLFARRIFGIADISGTQFTDNLKAISVFALLGIIGDYRTP